MCALCCCCRHVPLIYDYATVSALVRSEEEFYKEVSREVSGELLQSRQNGTFIIRPSKNSNLGTALSVVQDDKVFHLSVRRRNDGRIALGTEKVNEICFADINSLINYYISNYLVLYSDGRQTLTLLLPYRETSAF